MSCPNCGHPPTAAELRDGWCEECGKRLSSAVTEGPLGPVSTPGPIVSPVARPEGKDALAWGTVRAGLGVLFFGLFSFLVGAAAMIAAVLLVRAAGESPQARAWVYCGMIASAVCL